MAWTEVWLRCVPPRRAALVPPQVVDQFAAGKNGNVPVQDGETFPQRLQRVLTQLNGFTA